MKRVSKKVEKKLEKVLTTRNNFDKIIFADAPKEQKQSGAGSKEFTW